MKTKHNNRYVKVCMKTFEVNQTIIVCLLLLFSISIHAQESKIGTWKAYMSYQNATLVTETSNLVFAVYNGSLLSYSPEDEEVLTYSFREGLNDIKIAQMGYSPEVKALVLVYENANIDLFFGRNNVVNISSIKDKTISNKTINSFEIIGKCAYISTGFGIVEIDLTRREIKNQFRPGENTTAMCQWGDYFYAATSTGIKKGLISSNLADPENWEPFNLSNYGGNEKRITKMVIFKEQLVFFDGSNNKTYYSTKEGSVKSLANGACKKLAVWNEQLVLALGDRVFFYDDFNKYVSLVLTSEYKNIDAFGSKDTYWIAWGTQGLSKIKVKEIDNNQIVYEHIVSDIKVNSPLRNFCYYLTYTADKLLVTGGNRRADRWNVPGTLMVYEDGKWFNFDDKAISQETGLPCLDFLSVVVDPRDPNHYFVATWGEGVYEFKDNKFVNRHSRDNSSLETASPNSSSWNRYIRVDGLAYDKNNNLYMTNAHIQNVVNIFTAENEWISYFYQDLVSAIPNQILITKNNQKWISIFREGKTGIFVFDENNTIGNTTDDQCYYSKTFVDQQGKDVGATTYLCLAEDLNGTVWAGTDNGPISFNNATSVENGVCNRIISTDQYGEGYILLEGQRVTSIVVDGGNRKWMGTEGSGVFVVDYSNGDLHVENFTTSNSDLISNNIQSIAINNKTGEVFIGTDLGLVSYMSEAVEGSSDYSSVYAYPNPVRPTSNNQVVITGLMNDSDIKITDMSGNIMQRGTSIGGQYIWNCSNQTGSTVKAGIYLVFATLSDGSQGIVTKIMVIK